MSLPVSTLQRIDRWAGIPACFLLTLARLVVVLVTPSPAASKPRRILIIKFAEQGSTVLAGAALKRATEIAGRDNVYFLVFEENRFILDVLGVIPPENVIAIRTQGLVGAAMSALGALWRVRRLGIDAVVDMEFFSRFSAVLALLTGARLRVGFHTWFGDGPYRGNLLTHRLLYNPHLHTTQTFCLMIDALERDGRDFPAHDIVPPAAPEPAAMFTPRADETDEVRRILRDAAAADVRRLILLNPNASDLVPLRRWPTERYVTVAQRLLERFPDTHVAITGVADEADAARSMIRGVGSPRCFSLAGRTTLRQLLVVYSLADLLVTNDSGPAHFAAMTAVNVITLFGPETPRLFGAPTSRNSSLWAGIACSPCVNVYNNRQSACRNNVCMQAITVEQVCSEAVRMLEARERSGSGPGFGGTAPPTGGSVPRRNPG